MESNTRWIPSFVLKYQGVNWQAKYDDRNFLYCVIRHLWPTTAKIRHFKKIPSEYIKQFNLETIEFPLTFKSINKFVQKNKHLPLTIRVLFESMGHVCVLDTFSNIRQKKERYKNVMNVLMLKKDPGHAAASRLGFPSSVSTVKNLNHQHHFFNILNMNTFLNSRRKRESYYRFHCDVCLMHFSNKRTKQSHLKLCQEDKQLVTYPLKGSVLNFKKQRNCFKAPVIGFADFECIMEEFTGQNECQRCQKSSTRCDCDKSSNQVLNQHKACGYSVCFVDSDNDVFFQETYSGDDAVDVFLSKLDDYATVVDKRKQRFRKRTEVKATQEEWRRYHEATHCHICEREFVPESRMYKKVVDHDHVTGGKMQAAHSICNLHRQGPYHTPLYFHNGQG